MKAKDTKGAIDFDHIFNVMLKEQAVGETASGYLCDVKGIDHGIVYNELLPKKLIGYCPERKALAFPLMRGFLIVGIQYLTIESTEVDGKIMMEGREYSHEASDLETGIFNMEKNFREVIITNGILDLLSTGMAGVSIPSLKTLSQLKLFSDMKATVCFTNAVDRNTAVKRVIEILPKARIISLPQEFKHLNHLLLAKGRDAVKELFLESGAMKPEKQPSRPKGNEAYDEAVCRYFTEPGPLNTDAVLEAAKKRAKELNIGKIVISSCRGTTARKALDLFGGDFSIIVVTHVTGFKEPNYQELPEEERTYLLGRGAQVLTSHHAFGGVGRAFRNKTGTYQIDEVIAYTLRTFGQGTKVAIEIALMAADAGFVRTDEDIISIGGTAQGVDTALVLRGTNTHTFFDLKVKEVICKPASF
jgi:uncharacterized protein